MNEKNKHEIDELLSLYLDDEASERQRTELKRLIRHNAAIAERLEVMKCQRQLLNAMTIEAAPATMVDDVRAALERNLILDDFSSGAESSSGNNHLFVRRMLTNAAMLLLPMGLLAVVVFHIIKPPAQNPVQYVKTDTVLKDKPDAEVGAAGVNPVIIPRKEYLFNGTLTFTTDQQITVSNFVEKMIFDTGLINDTLPNRTADVTSFYITASPQQVNTLLDTMESIWPRCQTVKLDVKGADETIQIADIRLEQIKTLAVEDNTEMFDRLATRYASANLKKDTMFAAKPEENVENGYPPLRRPILTGRSESTDVDESDGGVPIKLKIYVKRTIE